MKKKLLKIPIGYRVNIIFLFAYSLAYILQWRLEKFDGYLPYYNYYTWLAVPIVIFAVYSAVTLLLYMTGKKKLISLVSVAVLTFNILLCGDSFVQIYRHFKNSYLLRNERYALQEISLEQASSIESGNYMVYVRRDSCMYCKETDYAIDNTLKNQPLKVYFYDGTADRENKKDEYYEFINKYGIEGLPRLIVFVNGKVDSVLTYDDISNNLDDILHMYRMKNIYFTEDL